MAKQVSMPSPESVVDVLVGRQPDDRAERATAHLALDLLAVSIEVCAVNTAGLVGNDIRHQRDHRAIVFPEADRIAAV
uniref:hypothetical protein n=1 Tax=Bradyrhizobium ottawaense TaxID=931866 RepID=UPI0038508A7C